MEILCDELLDFLGIALDGLAEGSVVESPQLGDDAVDHSGREDIALLEDSTLAFQAVSRSDAGVWELCKRSQTVGILSSMNIHIHVSALCHLKSIGHLEAVTTSDT